ncbi:shikimate kinase [Aurantimicrobium sp. INA4]|uniref:shikimate kinase n=1 Tax=Aurantimicrobium sp. INA4 TaxID=2986279 RepID=UPI0024937B15|nr:shikimate kinase [Aurantimicrobium sp. INA4]BDU10900.1 shikimate kinase [Aurantimicrobium sp. INA4]
MAIPLAVFIGPPASGKSKVAKRVAAVLNVPRIDTDKLVVAEYGPISEIFDTQGETAFRKYEREAVKNALQEEAIVSLGGGAVLNEESQSELRRVPVVLLTVSEEAVAERIQDPKRPLLRDGISAWKKLVSERLPIYQELAWLTLDTSDGDLDAVAHSVAEWIRAGYPRESSLS